MRRHRRERRAGSRQAESLHRPRRRLCRKRGDRARAEGLCESAARRLQVPALDRISRRAAEERARQDGPPRLEAMIPAGLVVSLITSIVTSTARKKAMSAFQHLTWKEAADAIKQGAVMILPVGSTEAHGPHLPLATDVIISQEMSRRAADQLQQQGVTSFVLPAMAYSVTD